MKLEPKDLRLMVMGILDSNVDPLTVMAFYKVISAVDGDMVSPDNLKWPSLSGPLTTDGLKEEILEQLSLLVSTGFVETCNPCGEPTYSLTPLGTALNSASLDYHDIMMHPKRGF